MISGITERFSNIPAEQGTIGGECHAAIQQAARRVAELLPDETRGQQAIMRLEQALHAALMDSTAHDRVPAEYATRIDNRITAPAPAEPDADDQLDPAIQPGDDLAPPGQQAPGQQGDDVRDSAQDPATDIPRQGE